MCVLHYSCLEGTWKVFVQALTNNFVYSVDDSKIGERFTHKEGIGKLSGTMYK